MKNASSTHIATLRAGGAILADVLRQVARQVQPGVATKTLDQTAHQAILSAGAEPAFLGYRGYPATLCTSVNTRVVHGVPSSTEILQEGDIIGLDLGIRYQGLYTDMAVTVPVGRVGKPALQLIEATRAALHAAVHFVRPGRRTGDLGAMIQERVEQAGFSVVRDLVGHGVGRSVHEDPMVPNFGTPNTGIPFAVGDVVAIEPMVTAGAYHVKTLSDGWTVETLDGSLAAHFEHTIVVTAHGADILTQTHGKHPWP